MVVVTVVDTNQKEIIWVQPKYVGRPMIVYVNTVQGRNQKTIITTLEISSTLLAAERKNSTYSSLSNLLAQVKGNFLSLHRCHGKRVGSEEDCSKRQEESKGSFVVSGEDFEPN